MVMGFPQSFIGNGNGILAIPHEKGVQGCGISVYRRRNGISLFKNDQIPHEWRVDGGISAIRMDIAKNASKRGVLEYVYIYSHSLDSF